MAWLAVSKDGSETIFRNKPTYDKDDGSWCDFHSFEDVADGMEFSLGFVSDINLPKGTIEKIIGRKMSYKEKPIELK